MTFIITPKGIELCIAEIDEDRIGVKRLSDAAKSYTLLDVATGPDGQNYFVWDGEVVPIQDETEIVTRAWLVGRMLEEFPGLTDYEADVNGPDLVQWLTTELDNLDIV